MDLSIIVLRLSVVVHPDVGRQQAISIAGQQPTPYVCLSKGVT